MAAAVAAKEAEMAAEQRRWEAEVEAVQSASRSSDEGARLREALLASKLEVEQGKVAAEAEGRAAAEARAAELEAAVAAEGVERSRAAAEVRQRDETVAALRATLAAAEEARAAERAAAEEAARLREGVAAEKVKRSDERAEAAEVTLRPFWTFEQPNEDACILTLRALCLH